MSTEVRGIDQSSMRELVKVPSVQGRINELLGKRAPQFCSTLIQMSNQPHLKGCTSTSLLGAAMTAAALDLPVNQNLGFAYMVPYKNKGKSEAQFQMGYKGYIQLAQRTGQYRTMNDAVIPCGCLVDYNELTGKLDVDFSKEIGDGLSKPDGYAFHFELLNGFSKTVFWKTSRLEKHAERYSQSFRSGFGPWVDNFDSMALKTVIKLTLSKYGMLSIDMQNALQTDQSVIDGTCGNSVEVDYIDNLSKAEDIDSKKEVEVAFDREKTTRTLAVLAEKRKEDFEAACDELGVPIDDWQDAPDGIMSQLFEHLSEVK